MNWPIVALDDIFTIARGGSPRPIDAFLTNEADGVNWIMIGDATTGSKYISSTKKRIRPEGVSRSRRVNPGDLLLTNSMSFGRPYIMNTSGCIHDGWLVLSPKRDDIDPGFFYHLLGSSMLYYKFSQLAAGAVVKNLNIELVKSVQISLPSFDEQRRIAAILDKADNIRLKRKVAIDQGQSYLWSVFYEMFGTEIEQAARLGKCSWPILTIDELKDEGSYSCVGGPFGSNLTSSDYVDVPGVPIIRGANLSVELDGYKDFGYVYVSEEKGASLEQNAAYPGDIVVTQRGTLGQVSRIPLDAQFNRYIISQSQMKIRVNQDKIEPDFLVSYMLSPWGQNFIKSSALVTGVPHINLGILKRLSIVVPPKKLQEEFIQQSKRVAKHLVRQRTAKEQADLLFASLQGSCFSVGRDSLPRDLVGLKQ